MVKKALFISKNLLGDGLNVAPALRAWHKEHSEFEIDLFTLPGPYAHMYERMGVPIRHLLTNEPPVYDGTHVTILGTPYDFIFNFEVGTAFTIGERTHRHITACYALMLGVDIGDERKPVYIPEEEEHERDLILVSLFSKSCSSNAGLPPNKMLPWDKTAPILELLRQYGRIGVLGAEGDHIPNFKNYDSNVTEDEYYTGLHLNKVALMLRDCKALFTIDNGLAHLAASQETRMVELYPMCLDPRWILPIGNKNAIMIHADPVVINLPGLLKVIRDSFASWRI